MTERVYNFSPGPATLPLPVLEQVRDELLALPAQGMSVLEISHRSAAFERIRQTAEGNIRSLLQVPDDYAILFLQGGATMQFSMVAINFLRGSRWPADYIISGSWAKKAAAEAAREGQVRVVWDGSPQNYSRLPDTDELKLNQQAAYIHFTSNETIQGLQFRQEPAAGQVPLICDGSSDFLSRPLDINRYALLYAGAQKNAGPAGVTIIIIHKDLLERVPRNQHAILDYRLQAEKHSVYNTPPVFAIYVVMLVTQWLQDDIGGLENMSAINRRKAAMLYEVIDNSDGFYRGHAQPESRSLMNVTWRLADERLEQTFIAEAEQHRLSQLKGHRSVGGLRASIYNAMPVDGVEALRDFMIDFQKRHG